MAKLEVHQFPTRSDNYGVLLHDPETEATAAIDAPDAEELLAALHEKGWTLTHILTTHHHHDHTAGNAIVKRMTGCSIVGPAKEAGSIPGIDIEVKDGDSVDIGGVKGRVIETPGHTKGHVSYYFPESGIVRPRTMSAIVFRGAASSVSATRCSRSVAASCSRATPR